MTPDENSRLSAMRKAGRSYTEIADALGIRRREFERFISELEKLPEAVSEFDETLWGSLVDYVTVGRDKTMTFTLIGGTEMKA